MTTTIKATLLGGALTAIAAVGFLAIGSESANALQSCTINTGVAAHPTLSGTLTVTDSLPSDDYGMAVWMPNDDRYCVVNIANTIDWTANVYGNKGVIATPTS